MAKCGAEGGQAMNSLAEASSRVVARAAEISEQAERIEASNEEGLRLSGENEASVASLRGELARIKLSRGVLHKNA
jgi:hypothetical protein